jgi:hypothetical protein
LLPGGSCRPSACFWRLGRLAFYIYIKVNQPSPGVWEK